MWVIGMSLFASCKEEKQAYILCMSCFSSLQSTKKSKPLTHINKLDRPLAFSWAVVRENKRSCGNRDFFSLNLETAVGPGKKCKILSQNRLRLGSNIPKIYSGQPGAGSSPAIGKFSCFSRERKTVSDTCLPLKQFLTHDWASSKKWSLSTYLASLVYIHTMHEKRSQNYELSLLMHLLLMHILEKK